MGDREIAVPNRTIHNRWMRHLAGLHSDRLEHMKSTLPQDPPPSFDFLSQRSKRNQAFMTRASAIERENLILLDKMRTIMSEKQMRAETSEPFLKVTLNRGRRKQEMIRIMNENEALLRRIQARRPVYEVALFEKAHAQKEYLLSRVGKFPYVSDSAPEATPPPLQNKQLIYYGYKGKSNQLAQKRLTAGAGGATLPKIATTVAAAGAGGSQTARSPTKASTTAAAAGSPQSPATSRVHGSAAPASTPAPPAAGSSSSASTARSNKIRGNKALVYSGQEIEIDGLVCQLSVFEKAQSAKSSAGLEFVAVDPPAHTSTALPIFYSFQALTAAFGAKDSGSSEAEEKSAAGDASSIPLSYFSQPDKTRELIITYLLPKLAWRPSGAGDDKRQLYMRGVEEEQSAAPARKPVNRGPMLYVRVQMEARGLPADQTTAAEPVAVMYALNEDTNQYQQIAHSTLRRSGTSPVVHKGSVVVPYYQRVDGPLRLGIFAVDPATKAVLPTACLGETKFGIQPMLSSEELVVRLIKSGSKATTGKSKKDASAEASVKITHTPASSASEEEEEQKQESNAPSATSGKKPSVLGDDSDEEEDLPKKQVVKKLFMGGRAISGVEFLVRATDGADVPPTDRPAKLAEPQALLYQLYYRPTSLVLDHAVAKGEIPALLKLLSPPCESSSLTEQAEALQGLFIATQHDGATPAVSLQFNGKPLVAWKDLPAFKSGAAGSKSSVKSSPKTSPRASTTDLAAAATPKKNAAASKKPAVATATPAKKSGVDAAKPASTAESPKAADSKKELVKKASSTGSKEKTATVAATAEAKPTEPKPAALAAVEAKPEAKAEAEAKPAEERSAEAKPADAKVADDKPAAPKPAVATAAASSGSTTTIVAPKAADSKPARPSSAADLDVDLGELDDLDDLAPAAKPTEKPAAAAAPTAAATAPSQVAKSTPAAADPKAVDTTAADAAAAKQKADEDAAKKQAADEAEKKKQADDAAAAKAKADGDAAAKATKAAEDAKKAAEEKKKAEADAVAKEADAKETAAKEAAAKDAAAKEAAEKDAAAAEAKKKSEADAAAAAAKKKSEEDATAAAAAAAAKAKSESDAEAAKVAELAAKEARRKKKAEEKATAAAAAKAAVEAEAKANLAKGPSPITLSMRVSCANLPAHPKHATLSPMVAMYAESLSGEYGFCSQSERVDPPTASPSFSTPLTFETDAHTPSAAVMFSIYHVVEGAALSEDDMVGQALSTQYELCAALAKGAELKLPIQSNGAIIPNSFMTLSALTQTAGHASKLSLDSAPKTPYEVFVSCRNLSRKGFPDVSPMVALYAANESGEYGYILQTERLESTSNPVFETGIRVEASSLVDQPLMFSIYHVAEGAEISADDAVGAATTSMHALVGATEAKPLKLPIVRDEATLEGAEITVFVKKI